MTENKRFVAIGVEWVDGFIQDHIGDRDLFNIGAVCKLLNELSEENEQLKKQLECSREEADDYCDELMGKDEFVRLYKRQRDDALKENKQLKKDNNRLVNETAKIIAEHQRKVFNLINAKIKLYSHKPVSAPISQSMSVNFDVDVDRLARLSELESLKEELSE